MKVANYSDDLVMVVRGDIPAIDVPVELQGVPADRLRYDGEKLVDAASVARFAIAPDGVKHLPKIAASKGLPVLACVWNDPIFFVGATPQLASAEQLREAEIRSRLKAAKAQCRQRIYAAASAPAQSNIAIRAAMLAAAAHATAEFDAIAAWLGWVDAMRACARQLAESGGNVEADDAWPALPDNVRQLIDEF